MFVFPMLGQSSRFFKSGYSLPKYQLKIHNRSVFSYAVRSFENYFNTDKFLFLVRNDFGAADFVKNEIVKLKIRDYEIKIFNENTKGQADSVFQGLKNQPVNIPIYIFNIDTFRPNFSKPRLAKECHGFLEVFKAAGYQWSFVEPGPNKKVVRTTEKNRISDLCSDGLYYFGKKKYFDQAYLYFLNNNLQVNNEYYIAPLYNYLIKRGMDIRYNLIDSESVFNCGIPDEYVSLKTDKRLANIYNVPTIR